MALVKPIRPDQCQRESTQNASDLIVNSSYVHAAAADALIVIAPVPDYMITNDVAIMIIHY